MDGKIKLLTQLIAFVHFVAFVIRFFHHMVKNVTDKSSFIHYTQTRIGYLLPEE